MVVFSADKLILMETCFMETIPNKECNEVWTIYFLFIFCVIWYYFQLFKILSWAESLFCILVFGFVSTLV